MKKIISQIWGFSFGPVSTLVLWAVALTAVACFLYFYEADFLWKTQEMNLFLNTSLFFTEQMRMAGGALVWLSTWFTQMLFHPGLGLLLLCGLWLLLMWLTKQAFALSYRWAVALLIPVALLLITIVDQGYWIYLLKLRGHFFLTTLGTIAVVALLWGFRCLVRKSPFPLHLLYIILTGAVGYPLMGIYGLAATLLMGLWAWRLENGRGKAITLSLVALLCVVMVPLGCYRFLYDTTNLINIYWVDLPLFFMDQEYHVYYIPYYLLAAFFVVLTLLPRFPLPSFLRSILPHLLLLVLMIVGVKHFWYKDENYHHELAMQHAIDQFDWQGVLDEAARQVDEPTRAIVMMRNLALARLGRQGDEMYRYKNGSKRSDFPFTLLMMQTVGPLVYYQYGLINFSYRLCMEMGVEYGWRADYYKMMTRCMLVNGEPRLARKYINILKQTTFFDSWAERVEDLQPADLPNDPDMGFVTHMMHYKENLASDQGYVESFIMKRLSLSTSTEDPVFLEQTLLASMWTRDTEAFWHHLNQYILTRPDKQLPIHVQEAAILFGSQENRTGIDNWPFSPSVRESYRRFNETAPKYDDMDIEPVRKALYPLFGHTYYYDYYLMDNLPKY